MAKNAKVAPEAKGDLKFLNTMTIEEFKDELDTTAALQIKVNPHTGKLFMTLANKPGSVGAVASKFTKANIGRELTKPVVSEVETIDGSKFYMLHQMGEGAETVIEF